MYINTGYLHHSRQDFKDKSRPLIVGSCGNYCLTQHPSMPTNRPREHVLTNEFLDRQMDAAVTYFNSNYNMEINIEEYAASIGMSVSWFIRNFRKYTGSTPVQFLTSLRLTNAQMLLETTTYSINEIAGIVGYSNPLYFSRLFHKQRGCSPSEYRLRNS